MLILARILEPLLGDDGCHRNDIDHAIPCQRSREELVLSRRRRLAFPQGSTFVVSIGSLVSSGAAFSEKCVLGRIRESREQCDHWFEDNRDRSNGIFLFFSRVLSSRRIHSSARFDSCNKLARNFEILFFFFSQVTASILQPIPVKLPSNWNLVFEFDVIWPIPTTEDYKRKKYKKYKRRQWMVKRRHRRELYATFETALNRYKQVCQRIFTFLSLKGNLPFSQNLPGRECTLRTICEARTLLSPPGDSFVEDALRLILRYDICCEVSSNLPIYLFLPSSLFLSFFFFSNVDNVRRVDSYDVAYRTETPCEVAYPCPVSLLKLLLSHLYHSNDLGWE